MVKQTTVCPTPWKVKSVQHNEKKWAVVTCNKLSEFPENYAEYKKNSPQRLYTVWLCLHNVFEKDNCRNGELIIGCLPQIKDRGGLLRRWLCYHWADGNVLYLYYLNVNILTMKFRVLKDVIIEENWVYLGPLCIISYNLILVYNYLKTKSLILKITGRNSNIHQQ